MNYSADFETTTDVNDCRVWAWGVCEIWRPGSFEFGTNLETFFNFMREHNGTYYFHNAKFDGEFIFSWLFDNGFTHNSSDCMITNTFQTLISDKGLFYECKICFKEPTKKCKGNYVVIRDSLKKLPMSVDRIAKAFKLPIHKLDIDYTKERSLSYIPTEEEIDYLRNDVEIVAMALHEQFERGLQRMTMGSDALSWFKNLIDFDRFFPTLDGDVDAFIRRSYRGGWTYANPIYQATPDDPYKTVGDGMVLDVNSLYPSVMYDRLLPFGNPVPYMGEYNHCESYPLFIQEITCAFELKKEHVPMVQIKNSSFYREHEYLTHSDGYIDMVVTNVDLELMKSQYHLDIQSYGMGFRFQGITGLFKDYIDYWMEEKRTNEGGKRELAKLMLNSLYGKFATNPDVTQKYPYVKDDLSIGYESLAPEYRTPVYTAMGSFITAYARDVTIRAAQSHYDRFLYADTDSLHLLGLDNPRDLCIHDSDLGAWKIEVKFDRGKYLRAKCYMEHVTHEGDMEVTPYNSLRCAGMPKEVRDGVTFDELKFGAKFDGKLRPKHVHGGIVLVDVPFTIL